MADEKTGTKEQVQGDAMIVATSMLKAPKARTAMKILPRTIEWGSLFIIIAFAILGLLVGMFLFSGLQQIVISGTIGGVVGYAIPYMSPLEGESLTKWLGLQAKDATAHRVNINGRRAKMFIGTYPLKRTAQGPTRLLSSGGNVKAQSYDERGYPNLSSTRSNPQLEQQKKLRKSSKKLKPSTQLTSQQKVKRGSRVAARNEQRGKAAPRVPKAKSTSVADIKKGTQGTGAKKRGKKRTPARK